jgi:hypothetical protein
VKKGETIMTRKMTIAILVLALCALLLPSTLIAKKLVERPNRVEGHTTVRVNLSNGTWVSEDWGVGTHTGRFTNEGSGWMLPDGFTSGSGIVTAANGDQLFWHSEVQGAVTISGGTGRFEGATGVITTGLDDPPEITFENGTMIIKYTYTGTGTITY